MTTKTEEEIIERFNLFIKKWCGSSFPHLIDSDENEGEEFRDFVREAISAYREKVKMAIERIPERSENKWTDKRIQDYLFAELER